jgi:RNA polymerase sigma factor (sigma-70 family)
VSDSDNEIYRKHAADLNRFAAGLVGPSQAADVVSEAVLKCLHFRRWPQVDDKRAYLYRSVLNEANSLHRSSQRRTAREKLSAQPERVEFPEVRVRPEVLAAVFRLSMRQRAVIFLIYWEDLDIPSVAGLLKVSEGSVRRHLARGKTRLKEALHADD